MKINKVNFYGELKPLNQKNSNNPIQTNNSLLQKEEATNNKTKIAVYITEAAGITTVVASAFTKKGRAITKSAAQGLKNLGQKIFKSAKNEKIDTNKNVLVDVDYGKMFDVNQDYKEFFIKEMDKMKNPYRTVIGMNGKKVKEKNFPPNGFLLFGPKSKAREEMFDWMIEEMRKRNVEIVDPGNGKSAKEDVVRKTWNEMWGLKYGVRNGDETYKKVDEEFAKTGRFKVFAVRDLDEMGKPFHSRPIDEFPEAFLKDSPDSHESCKNHGIMLFYSCKDPSVIDPAVIRGGRIDERFIPRPKDDEPLEIWKDYLEKVKSNCSPMNIVMRLDDAKNRLKSRGEDFMKKLESHFAYSVPYQKPMHWEPKEKWVDYIEKTMQNVDREKGINELYKAFYYFRRGKAFNENGLKQIEEMSQLIKSKMTPEEAGMWDRRLWFEKNGMDFIYYDEKFYQEHLNDPYYQGKK